MSSEKHAKVLRILDDQNRLVERADTKAISLLSTMGIFSFFFISQFGNIPIDIFSIILLVIYFAGVFTTLLHIILAISPRIHPTPMKPTDIGTEHTSHQPTFYAGICKFLDAAAYQKCLEDLLDDESATTELYVQQIYEVAKINNAKYKYVQRAIWLVVLTLSAQLIIIAYTLSNRPPA